MNKEEAYKKICGVFENMIKEMNQICKEALEKEQVVAIDLSKGDGNIIGTALFDSVTKEAWDYIYKQGYNDCNKKWRDGIEEIKEEII